MKAGERKTNGRGRPKKKEVLVEHNKADMRKGSDDEISLPILFCVSFFFVKRIYLRLLRTGVSSFFFLQIYYSRTLRVCSFVCVRVFFPPLYAPPLFSFFLFTASPVSFFLFVFLSWLIPSSFLSLLFRLAPPSLFEYVVQWLSPSSAYDIASWFAFVLFFSRCL